MGLGERGRAMLGVESANSARRQPKRLLCAHILLQFLKEWKR
jgi:hypothetical protein